MWEDRERQSDNQTIRRIISTAARPTRCLQSDQTYNTNTDTCDRTTVLTVAGMGLDCRANACLYLACVSRRGG